MTKVDQFESAFNSAAKTPYHYKAIHVRSVLVLTDLPPEAEPAFEARVRGFLRVLDDDPGAAIDWTFLSGTGYGDIDELLALIRERDPDLIVTYRSLHSQAWRWSYTLGRYVDILAQETRVPVLLLPNPTQEAQAPESFPYGPPRYGTDGTPTVMAMTDHLAGDDHLLDWAVRFTQSGGKLVLSHVEDGTVFDRYIELIGKIPEIDTDLARERIEAQIRKEPSDFIESCRTALDAAELDMEVLPVVKMGHQLREYGRLISEHQADLLVLNTKDADQLAMHGLAYPLVVELRHVPILML